MCKAIDDATTAARTSNTVRQPLVAPKDHQEQQPSPPHQQTRKRKVRFSLDNKTLQLPPISAEEKAQRWYNGNAYQEMRWEIGAIVKGKALSLDLFHQKDSPDNIYCYRGLEFLKLDPQSTEPSRKERRALYVKNTLVYQQVMNPKQATAMSADEALGIYCARMSKAAQKRAHELAGCDEEEARRIYHDCHLMYFDAKHNQEFTMFSSKRSSLCRDPVEPEPTANSFQDVINRIFGGAGLCLMTTVN